MTMDELRKRLSAPPVGLFQSYGRVGQIIPVMKVNGEPTMQWIPTFNDCRGENTAMTLMNRPDFVAWAIDPWSGVVNVKFSSV